MKPYKSKSGKASGVTAYRTGDEFIVIQFKENEIYTYSYKNNSKSVIEKMKKLALASKGLTTFISQYKPTFDQ